MRVLLVLLLSVSLLAQAGAEESQKQLLAAAKIDRTHAEVIARGRAREGKVESSKIAREKGRLIWIVGITMPNTNALTQVRVDASTGKVISMRKLDQAKPH